MARPLGKTQEDVLRALRSHGSWSRGCGWCWDTRSGTERVLDSLVRRGLVVNGQSPYGWRYYPAPEGGS